MLSDITFGQYFPVNSLIHKSDPRVKIVLLIVLIVFVLLTGNYYSLGLVTLFSLSVMILSKIPPKLYFKNLKAILPIIIFTSLINAFYTKTGKVLLSF